MTELGEDLPASSGAVMGLRSASIPIDLRARGEPRAGDARPRGGEVPGSLAELLIGGKVRGEPRRGEPERDGEVDRPPTARPVGGSRGPRQKGEAPILLGPELGRSSPEDDNASRGSVSVLCVISEEPSYSLSSGFAWSASDARSRVRKKSTMRMPGDCDGKLCFGTPYLRRIFSACARGVCVLRHHTGVVNETDCLFAKL